MANLRSISPSGAPAVHALPYSRLLRSDTGNLVPNVHNAMMLLREDGELKDLVAFNEMDQAIFIMRPPPGPARDEGPFPRAIRDDDITAVQSCLQRYGLSRIGSSIVAEAISSVAREHRFHPVRDWLNDLKWDGIARVDRLFGSYAGVADTAYTRGISAMFMISVVARIYEPGCKVDNVVVLEGQQGIGKSSMCRILGGPWFSDSLPADLSSRDAGAHLRGKLIIEISELGALSRNEVQQIKAFITRQVEIYRPPYGRNEVHEPRQCVFVGTTNQSRYLRDSTGGRRFWPVPTGKIDLFGLQRDRDQLFAESVARFQAGQPWWPDASFEAAHLLREQDERREDDAWEESIASYLAVKERATVAQIAREALCFDTSRIGTADQRRIASNLEALGWRRAPRGPNGERYWERASGRRTDTSDASSS